MARGSRVRLIGGPNGSGKSTLLDWLSGLAATEHFPLGFVQNPDAIQQEIAAAKRLFLGPWGVRTSDSEFARFVDSHPLRPRLKTTIPQLKADALTFEDSESLGYLIPVVCEFFRHRWIASRESFTFETVMSGHDKLEMLRQCRAARYRSYLYYICTDNVSINSARIDNRVKQGGHSVPPEKLRARYDGSIGQLADAIKVVDRAYIFDNSGKQHQLIATFESGRVERIYGELQPRWFLDGALKHF